MDAGLPTANGTGDVGIDGELVASGMNGELQRPGKAEGPDGEGDDGYVGVELRAEEGGVADIVHPFVELARELRRDGLDGDALVRDCGEDGEKFGWTLRLGRLVHGDLGGEIVFSATLEDPAVDLARLAGRRQVFRRDGGKLGVRDDNGFFKPFQTVLADKVGVAHGEILAVAFRHGLSNGVGDVDREEVGSRRKGVYIGEANVVGVDEIGPLPAKGGYGGVGFGADILRARADKRVLAEGLVPDGGGVDAAFADGENGLELGLSFEAEAVANADGDGWEFFHGAVS